MINGMWIGFGGLLSMVGDSMLYMRKRYLDNVRSMRQNDTNGVKKAGIGC